MTEREFEPTHPGTVTEPTEPALGLARKNVLFGWALFAICIVLAAGTVVVALIYDAVANY